MVSIDQLNIDYQRVSIMIELQALPLCKKKIKQLHSHLRNKHCLSAKERPYMKIARETAVKHKDTVLNEIIIFTVLNLRNRNVVLTMILKPLKIS